MLNRPKIFLGCISLVSLISFVALGRRDDRLAGMAPAGSVDERRSWGEETFGDYLLHADEWIASSKMIAADLGAIELVAPIDSPNRYHPGFTDGYFCEMNLEVIGANGRGILTLPYFEVASDGIVSLIGDEATWVFGGKRNLIHKSGDGYLNAYGLEKTYDQLMRLSANQSEQIIQLFRKFETDVQQTTLRSRGARHGKPSPLTKLHELYREPLLRRYANALKNQGDSFAAADAFGHVADLCLWRVEQSMKDLGYQSQRTVQEELDDANALLRAAADCAPEDETVLRLAKQRSALAYLHAIGSSPRPREDQDKSEWASTALGDFLVEAKAFAKRSPLVAQQAGKNVKIHIAENARSELRINRHGVFEGVIFLDIDGSKGDGRLLVTVCEDHKTCPAVDLFAPKPRATEHPLNVKNPSWTPKDGASIRLHAQTGERKSR